MTIEQRVIPMWNRCFSIEEISNVTGLDPETVEAIIEEPANYGGEKMQTDTLLKDTDHFWMVYIEGKGAPTHKHFLYDEVHIEAERLLRLQGNQERKAYILETVCFGVIENLPITWRNVS